MKLDDLKKEIGYVKQSPRCSNCKYCTETEDEKRIAYYPYTHFIIHKKCTKFNFATKPNSYCSEWEDIR